MNDGNKQIESYLDLQRPEGAVYRLVNIWSKYARQRRREKVEEAEIGAELLPELSSKVAGSRQRTDDIEAQGGAGNNGKIGWVNAPDALLDIGPEGGRARIASVDEQPADNKEGPDGKVRGKVFAKS
jgi:hypothetical protein